MKKPNAEQLAKYVKAGAIILSAAGYTISPEQSEALVIVAGLAYGLVSAAEAYFFKKTK